jgi:hypothetical protein
MALPDLITPGFVQGLFTVDAAQIAGLPSVVTGASRLVRKWTNRKFSRATYDELYTIDPQGQLLTREYPINSIRVRSNPTTVLTINQTDSTTNQDAWVTFSSTGGQDSGVTLTGLILSRYASGIQTDSPFLFSTYTTIASLTVAINALGSNWTATADQTYHLWGTADLRANQGAMPALSGDGARLQVHTQTVPVVYDAESGIVSLNCNGNTSSMRWGPTSSFLDDQELRGSFLAYRVILDAGYDTIPEDLQIATAEIVKAMLDRALLNSTLASEALGDWRVEYRMLFPMLPSSAQQTLGLYTSHRA